MKPYTQILIGDSGNCFQAALASVLEAPLDSVPDFVNNMGDWFDAAWYWLRFQGYYMSYIENKDGQENKLFMQRVISDSDQAFDHVVVGVDSLRADCTHTCVWSINEERIVHDPMPGNPCVRLQPKILGAYSIHTTTQPLNSNGKVKV